MFYNIFTKWLQENCGVMFQKVYPNTDAHNILKPWNRHFQIIIQMSDKMLQKTLKKLFKIMSLMIPLRHH